MVRPRLLSLAAAVAVLFAGQRPAAARERWSAEEAKAWQARTGWLAGANFAPSSAINQLEMWQAETFNAAEIDRELGWAEGIGFNSVRVFLHHLLWDVDREGFLHRLDEFLALAAKRHIGVMLVPLDGVWDPEPRAGKQPAPRPHLHNSGWVQSPGAALLGDPKRHEELKPYIQGLVRRLRSDQRVHAWDVFNEPDNDNRNSYGENGTRKELKNKAEMATLLLKSVFRWAREADPTQPLTAGVWLGPWPDESRLLPIERVMLEESDIISFHNYGGLDEVRPRVEELRRYGRPIVCTEYMARPRGSRFDPLLAYFKEAGVGAYNWGFVAGKSQTIYPWETWQKKQDAEPAVWFHDIFRRDGAPFDPKEIETIRSVTGKR